MTDAPTPTPEPEPTPVSAPGASAEFTATSDGDEARRRFREALDRKKAQRGGGHGSPDPARPVVPTTNPRAQRMFRRKSG